MEKIILKNEIPLIIKDNKDTPRVGFCLYMSLDAPEEHAGDIALTKSLLFQGTKSRTGEELATTLDENGIECYTTSSKDHLCFKILCLNEDFKIALSILKDIIFNSTFELFEKEKTKLKGDLLADLDSPQIKAVDEFSKNMFLNHPYGNTRSVILQDVDNITREEVIAFYENILNNSKKNIVLVGDLKEFGTTKDICDLITENFGDLKNSTPEIKIPVPKLVGKKLVTTTKEDATQAQVLQGWIFPSIDHKDCAAISVMNTILGSCGLSSRLFQELREKKGLAYTVRSSYDLFKQCGCLRVYIGTDPVNIQTAVDGFKTEINKLKEELVPEEELVGGKNAILGKRQFALETNIQQASAIGLYDLLGVGYDFEEKFLQDIAATTAEDVMRVANKYFTDDYILYVLAQKVNVKL